jgi:hypothetical protein
MNFIKSAIIRKIDSTKLKLLSDLAEEEKSQKKVIENNNSIIQKKKTEIDALDKAILEKENNVSLKKQQIENYQSEIDNYDKKLWLIEQQYKDCVDFGPEIPEAYGLYDRVLPLENSVIYKKKIDDVRKREKELIGSKAALISDSRWRVNESLRDGKKLTNRMSKLALRAFNGECDAIIESVKNYSKIESKKNKISLLFKTINELISILNQRISQQYLRLKFEELNIVFDYENALAKEKEELKKQREIERDEEIAKREFLQEIRRIDKERTHFSNELEKMIADMKEAQDIEKNKYQEKINILENKIAELTQKKEDFQNRFANKAGYVYIISNVGSFGDGVYKIGTTRRIDPFERINELSNASVPFRFDHYAIIFSENCYELEHMLHKRFEENRVNKINLWKEYFKIDKEALAQEIIKIDPTVKINDQSVTFEYSQTNDVNISKIDENDA